MNKDHTPQKILNIKPKYKTDKMSKNNNKMKKMIKFINKTIVLIIKKVLFKILTKVIKHLFYF